MNVRSALRGTGTTALIVAAVLLLVYLLLVLTAERPVEATTSLLIGPLETPGRTSQWLLQATYLTITGVAVALVFRVGQFSLGAEGQLLVGALAAAAIVLALPDAGGLWILGLIAAATAGFAWGAVPGLLKARWEADELVSTLMLNYVALAGFALAVKTLFQPEGAGYVVSDFIAPSAYLPSFGTPQTISLGLVLAVLLCVLAAGFLQRTRLGYEFRLTGSSRPFARAVGVRVERSIWLSMALSGAIAGLAGGVILEAQSHRLIVGMSANLGYDGILVALLVGNRPLLIPLGALAYGYLKAGGDVAQITSNTPRELVTAAQGLLILLITARVTGAGTRLRAALRRRLPDRRVPA